MNLGPRHWKRRMKPWRATVLLGFRGVENRVIVAYLIEDVDTEGWRYRKREFRIKGWIWRITTSNAFSSLNSYVKYWAFFSFRWTIAIALQLLGKTTWEIRALHENFTCPKNPSRDVTRLEQSFTSPIKYCWWLNVILVSPCFCVFLVVKFFV